MKTKPIPAIVMLTAGFITCMMGIFQKMEFLPFAKMLLIVMICFYVLGSIIAYILEKNFSEMEEKKEAEEADSKESEEDGENTEKVESEEEKQ